MEQGQSSSSTISIIEILEEARTTPLLPILPSTTKIEVVHKLRAEDVGFFDFEYQSEQRAISTIVGAITAIVVVVNAGKYVFYRDVYVSVDRLKNLTMQHGDETVRNVIVACLRGSTLMWYSIELPDYTREQLRLLGGIDNWYHLLISRFKIRASMALAQLTSSFYTLVTIKHTPPRVWILHMLHLAKAADIISTHNQLTLIWNRFHVQLRRDLLESTSHTELKGFLEWIDSRISIWQEMADSYRVAPSS